MNINQIKKLQNKVGKKVGEEFEEREKKEKAEKMFKYEEIKKHILRYQNDEPNRGGCVCIYENLVYTLDINDSVKANPFIDIKLIYAGMEKVGEVIYKNSKMFFYMQNKEVYQKFNEKFDWVKDQYPNLKMAMNQLRKGEGKLENTYILGKIFGDYTKKFPESSMHEFHAIINSIDNIIS